MKVCPYPVFVSLTYALLFLLCGLSDSYAQTEYAGVRTIMLDPGHGGRDPGTVYGNYREKDIVLNVALKLGALIERNLPDVRVLYTRKTDEFIELARRGEMANQAGADLFVSIHVNAVDPGRRAPSGALTLVMGQGHEDRNLDVAMRENDVIIFEDDYSTKYEGYTPGSAESFIIFSLMQYVHLEQSMMLASLMQEHYKRSSPMPDLGARQQKLLVLWKTAMPSVLTELGFLPNDADRAVLTSDAGQDKLAASLFNAISEYKSRVENKSVAVSVDAAGARGDTALAAERPVGGEVVYMVQVCSSSQRLGRNGNLLRPHKDRGVTEKIVDGLFKYYVGSCGTYAEAVELQREVRSSTPDAFMVAFRDGVQIPVSEARNLTGR
ncbi:MAG: N-acetylmuramoyl-L-alanine amidase [Rikenellaceae bacterium]|nr:N-acetylmuramoyl-L-alanine amidase [Rikenellaceae bacterium]